jgi:uncharacterized membrane-anchored protein YitT (DUF2179 family)
MKDRAGTEIKNAALIIIGIFSAAFGIKGYLLSSHFIDGGATGISMLLNNIFDVPLYVLLPLINLPFVILGYYQMGAQFAVRSTLAILGLALCLAFVTFPDVTPDKLLTAVFGGFFLGVGIGLAIRGSAVLDGTEIAALLVSRNTASLKVSDVILIMNVIIFAAAAFFLGIEPASYSILTYIAASKTIDFLLHGLEEYTGVTIVSEKSEEVQMAIVGELGRGITVYQGKGGHGKHGESAKASEILFTVVTRLELGRLQNLIKAIDADAFIIQHSINDVQGGIIKKRPMH